MSAAEAGAGVGALGGALGAMLHAETLTLGGAGPR
jgi:hypothetical protein